jgi:DNA-binding transcriptional ArsR family regulator
MEKDISFVEMVANHLLTLDIGVKTNARDVSSNLKIGQNQASAALSSLEKKGMVKALGREGRMFVYEIIDHPELSFSKSHGRNRIINRGPHFHPRRKLPPLESSSGLLSAVEGLMEAARVDANRDPEAEKPLSERLLDLAIEVAAMERRLLALGE